MAIRVTQVYVSVLRPLGGIAPQDVNNILALEAGNVADLPTKFTVVVNAFSFDEIAEHQYVYRSCANEFFLVSTIGMDVTEDIVQYLNLTPRQLVDVNNSLFANVPGFPNGSQAFPVEFFNTDNAFNLSETLGRAYKADNSFSLVEVAAAIFPYDLVDIFSWTQVIDPSGTEYGREETQHCIKQAVSYSINNGPCVEKNYRPFISEETDDSYETIDANAPTLVSQTLHLRYPATGMATHEFDFKNPRFGNLDSLQFTVIDRTTRGGDRIIYGDPKWAKAQLFEYEITNVKKETMEAFVEFVNASLGKDILLTDWFGQAFKGVIIAPQSPITETNGGYSVSLRFQGEQQ